MVLIGWFLLNRFRSLLLEKTANRSMLLLRQQVDQLRTQVGQVLNNSTQPIRQQLSQLLGHVNERLWENAQVLHKTQHTLGERLDNAARVVGSVPRSLGGLDEANGKIYEVGKDIASLQEILGAPKFGGGSGEFFLEDPLAHILSSRHFSTQYSFRSGEKVDAVIRLGSSPVPVNAKFRLENFKRILDLPTEEEKTRSRRQFVGDVKRHIDAIASKYILPDEGTYDFALMYISAENT
jgi:DNA recombination protein RmuC